jgi:hypothetical protein
MRTSCLSRKYAKFVCFLIFVVPPIHGNDRKNTKKALLNIWNETTCIHYPRKLGEKLPNTEVEYLRIHKPMRTSCLSRKFEKFVCFSVFCVPPIHDNARKNTKHKLFCK